MGDQDAMKHLIALIALIAQQLAGQQAPILIDAAGPGDQYYSPAGTCVPGGTCRTTNAAMGMPPMNTQRFGYDGTPFKYAVPVPNGTYDVVLAFAEPSKTQPNQRVFTVTVQGERSAPVDLVKLTGGPDFPYYQTWRSVQVRAGMLTITFEPVLSNGSPIGNPVVNAINISVSTPALLTGADGQNKVFALPAVPTEAQRPQLAVYWNGIYQTQGIDYTVAADMITFTNAPETGAVLTAR